MRPLKDETKQKIIAAGREEFRDKGYLDASIRTIAQNAGVSVGNVYRYFKNKEDLFDHIMRPLITELEKIVQFDIPDTAQPEPMLAIAPFADAMVTLIRDYGAEFWIALQGSKGSSLENVRADFSSQLSARFRQTLAPQWRQQKKIDEVLIDVLAVSLVESFCTIITYCSGDTERMRQLIIQMVAILFTGFIEKI